MTSNNETFKEVLERVNNKISEIEAFILGTTLKIETMIDQLLVLIRRTLIERIMTSGNYLHDI